MFFDEALLSKNQMVGECTADNLKFLVVIITPNGELYRKIGKWTDAIEDSGIGGYHGKTLCEFGGAISSSEIFE